MVQDAEFIGKVLAYAQETPYRIPLEAAELAPGVVTVYDVSGDYDTYFDRTRWDPSHPDTWGDLLFEGMEETGMEILLGVSNLPRIDSFRAAFQFARYHLQSTADVRISAQPQL